MNIDRYRNDHATILGQVEELRQLIRSGIEAQADAIAEHLVRVSSGIKFHLLAEDSVLYPAMEKADAAEVVALSRRYRAEMAGIAQRFREFVARWRVGARIGAEPETFRHEANEIFRALYERLQREDRELYPAAEQL
ncbi:hemerythrin domain-containing protein [Lysobacter sp. F60174L2]|uniref:hemerythrin domain-containing protein n=1 Tax=Lysobacter sp. F60174L2 TaxID=3459295 RepID=UPI00403D6621